MLRTETLETEVLRVLTEAAGRRVTAREIAAHIAIEATGEQVCRAMARLRRKGEPIKFRPNGPNESWYWLGKPTLERLRRGQRSDDT